MQALSPDEYQRLDRLARVYLQHHAQAYKRGSRRNPALGVDALCFQRLGNELLGALITPMSLSLALISMVSPQEADETQSADRRIVSLPSGQYSFVRESLGDETVWRCELLDDMTGLSGPEDASQLAQRLMRRVMSPAENVSPDG